MSASVQGTRRRYRSGGRWIEFKDELTDPEAFTDQLYDAIAEDPRVLGEAHADWDNLATALDLALCGIDDDGQRDRINEVYNAASTLGIHSFYVGMHMGAAMEQFRRTILRNAGPLRIEDLPEDED